MKLKDFDFRIWNKKINSYASVTYQFEEGKASFVPREVGGVFECIELWSGLCDKNGTRIYKGDILLYDNLKFVLNYKFMEFILIELKDNGKVMFLNDYSECEVIGNIHENADLLKGVK